MSNDSEFHIHNSPPLLQMTQDSLKFLVSFTKQKRAFWTKDLGSLPCPPPTIFPGTFPPQEQWKLVTSYESYFAFTLSLPAKSP